MKQPSTFQSSESWLGSKRPIVIAGPCSAETHAQVLQTARAIAKIPGITAFRAGIWKPRTRPSGFEGVGNQGLKWLEEAKKETGLALAVEVANPEHVELCLKHGVDILWIGARTSVNPFSVQEIATALQGCDTRVLVKNPIHPDVALWLGTLERIEKAGIRQLGAVHRGFYTYEQKLYRNQPLWEVPIELMRRCPELPMLCDPSHIGGNTSLLGPLAQKAMDLEMKGLMIETHIHPPQALTDSQQQLRPDELETLLSKLVCRNATIEKTSYREIENLRASIDEVDMKLIQALLERLQIVETMGKFKKDHQMTILQLQRWNEMLSQRLALAESTGLRKDFLLSLFELLHREAILIQTQIMEGKQES